MLQKQIVPLSFEQGIDTKKDKKQQVFGTFRRAENIVFETTNSFKKRNGYNLLQPRKSDGSLSTAAAALAAFNKELLLFEPSALYAYSSALGRLSSKGAVYSVALEGAPVVNNSFEHDQVDTIYLEGLEIFFYRNSSSGTVRYSVRDYASKSFLVADALVGSGECPRVANIQNQVYLLYVDGVNLKSRKFSITTPETLSSPSTHFTDVSADAQMDVAISASKIFVAYNANNAGDELTIFSINSSGSVSTAIGITGSAAPNAIDCLLDASGRLVVTFADATAIYYLIMPANLGGELLSATLISSIADVTSCTTSVSGSDYLVYYTVDGASYNSNIVKQVLVEFDGTVGAITDFKRGVSLASKQFTFDDVPYVAVGFSSPLQSTYFVLDADGAVIAKISPSNGGDQVTGSLPKIASISSSIFNLPSLVKTRLDVDGTSFFSVEGINATAINFTPTHAFQNAFLGSNLLVSGGLVQMYDGDSIAEHGFNVYPESLIQATQTATITVATTQAGVLATTSEIQTLAYSFNPGAGSFTLTYGAETTAAIAWNASNATIKAAIEALPTLSVVVTVTGSFAAGHTLTYDNADGNVAQPTATSSLTTPLTGGFMSNGVYSYIALYKWTDNYGQEHRSPASPSIDITLAGGGSTQQAAVKVPTLRLTNKSNVVIELYRTEAAGTIFYKATSETAPNYSITSADTITIVDTISDASLIAREPLYTTGGVLENTAPPAAKLACTWLNRIVLAGLESGGIQPSKYRDEGKPVEFADELRMPVQPVQGAITAVASLNEKLIIFERAACLYMTGDGPNNLGQQDSWSIPEEISTDVGCSEPNSIVMTKHGLMFKSNKGIYLLDNGLNLTYIGDRVEEYNSLMVTSAEVIADKNQVRFTTSNGPCLVYNYELNQWATFTNHAAQSAKVVDSQYYYLRQDSALFAESSAYADNGVPIKMVVETGWLSFAGLQGFLRAYKLMVLGAYKSPHSLRLQVGYDFIEAWSQERTIPLSDVVDTSAYGDTSPYGADAVYGGPGTPYQIRFDLKKQKCQSLKLRLSDVQSESGEGLSLSGITFEMGGKSGMFKPAQSAVKGTR
jgi:hypothetical protein